MHHGAIRQDPGSEIKKNLLDRFRIILIDPEDELRLASSECIQPTSFSSLLEGAAMTVMTSVVRAVSQLPRWLGDWDRRVRMRRELGRMPARMLVDIGLSPEAVARELRAPFWQPLGFDLAAPTGSSEAWQAAVARGPALPPQVRSIARLATVVFPNRA
jgi:uncharacterized protein YjiS (DUF1127 family)